MEIVYISLLTIIASWVGTVSGFGISTILVPALSLFYPLTPTLLLVGIIHWFGDIWKLILFKKGIKAQFIFLFGFPGIFATYIGARLVFEIPEVILSRSLGLFLLLYVVFIIIKPSFKLSKKEGVSVVGGALYGLSAGAFGVGGAIRSAFLSTFNLPKEVYIATSGAIGIVIDTVRLGTYISNGANLGKSLWLGLLIFIPTSLVGAKLAQKVVLKIPQKRFRNVIAIFLAISSLLMLLRK